MGTRTFWLFRGWYLSRYEHTPASLIVNWGVFITHFQVLEGKRARVFWYSRSLVVMLATLTDSLSFVVTSEGICLSFKFIFTLMCEGLQTIKNLYCVLLCLKMKSYKARFMPRLMDSWVIVIIYVQDFFKKMSRFYCTCRDCCIVEIGDEVIHSHLTHIVLLWSNSDALYPGEERNWHIFKLPFPISYQVYVSVG